MGNTSMNIRTDSDVKKQAEMILAEFGLNMTTAINMFLRQVIREQGIPFDLTLRTYNAKTLAAIEEGEWLLRDPNAKRYSSFSEILEEAKDEV